jgi:hypothetical protein
MTKRRRIAAMFSCFLMGLVVASIGWGILYFRERTQWALAVAVIRHGEATMGESILKYLEKPDETNAQRIMFVASNYVALFPTDVAEMDRFVPFLSIRDRYYGSEIARLEQFMKERNDQLRSVVSTNQVSDQIK